MPTVYKQIKEQYDGKLGKCKVEFCISDDYYELFDQTAPVSTEIFNIGSISEDLDIEAGVQAVDELSFSMNGLAIKTTDDQNCYDFVLNGIQSPNERWCAVFIAPIETGDIDALAFTGKLRYEAKATDYVWNDAEWGTTQDPVRVWEFTAELTGVSELGNVPLNDSYNNTYGGSIGLLNYLMQDTSWINANVSRRLHDYVFVDQEIYIKKLVELYKVVDKLITISQSNYLQSRIPGITITAEYSQSSFQFLPGDPKWQEGRYLILDGYNIENTQPVRLWICGNDPAEENPVLIDFNMVGTLNEKWEKYSFRQYDNFMELLTNIAICFGCYLEITQPESNQIKIKFKSRQEIGTIQSYLIDSETATLNIEYAEQEDQERYFSQPNDLVVEGNDMWVSSHDKPFQSSNYASGAKYDGNRLLFSLSPARYRFDQNDGLQHYYPHNGQYWDSYSQKFIYTEKEYITTAIYQKSILEPAFIRPCVTGNVKIDDREFSHSALGNLVNAVNAIDGDYYSSEYELEVPYLNGFSANSDGSSPSWKHIQTGRKVVIDSIEYVVVGIERDLDNFRTKLRLHRVSQYAFAQPSANLMTFSLETMSIFLLASQFTGIGADTIDVGCAVFMGDDKKWHYAYSESANGGIVGGVSITSCSIDEEVTVQIGGTIQIAGVAGSDIWDWTPGLNEKVYVRAQKGVTIGLNLSQNELTGIDGSEDFHISVGIPVSKNEIALDFSEQWIFED